LCARYFNNGQINEDFLLFVPVTDVTGKGLATTLLTSLDLIGIDYNYMIGQGYDGAAAMSGVFYGAHVYVQEKCPLAIYVHCAYHSLNLVISDSCNITSIRNCLGSVESIYNFFNSPKRQNILTTSIQNIVSILSHTKLKHLCPTRWVQRYDSVIIYLELQDTLDDRCSRKNKQFAQ